MKETYPVEYGKRTWKALVQVEKYGYEMPEVFTDFVHFVLNALLSLTDNMKYGDFKDKLTENRLTGMYEDRYMEIVAKYKENKTRKQGDRPADYFADAWSWLQTETAQTQKDVLGHLYESQITLGRQGQFFTPHNIVRAMAEMLSNKPPGEEDKTETVHDPACGSGRAFIIMAQENPNRKFVGIDISPLMSRMAALNMWLFNLYADILQGNTLSMEMNYMWQIRPGGWIWESKIEDGKPDGTVEDWLTEARKNHPPMPEEERLALIADYERWEKILSFIREMESQFRHGNGTTTEAKQASIEYRRIDDYQPLEGDTLFTVAFVFEQEEGAERVSLSCPHYAHERASIEDKPAIVTTANFASAFEEAIGKLTQQGETVTEDTIPATTLDTKQTVEDPPIADAPAETADNGQARLPIDLPPEKPRARKKNKQTGSVVQQSLFELE